MAIYSSSSYVCSRIYLHNPPGEANGPPVLIVTPEVKAQRALLQDTDPQVNQWICLTMLIICIGLLAATAEWVCYLLIDAQHL